MQSQDLFSGKFPSLKVENKYPVLIGDYCRVFNKVEQRTVEGIAVTYKGRNHQYIGILTLEGKYLQLEAFTAKKIPFACINNREVKVWAENQSALLLKRRVVEEVKPKKRGRKPRNASLHILDVA